MENGIGPDLMGLHLARTQVYLFHRTLIKEVQGLNQVD